MDKRELFICCKTGDLLRIKHLVKDKDVDLQARDKWGGTPLYYASLCGHYDVVLFLLQNGVKCIANTFDGERCMYAALTEDIRNLLLNYNVVTSTLMRRDRYSEFLRRAMDTHDYSDVEFLFESCKVEGHKSILTSRSSYIQSLLSGPLKDKTQIQLDKLNIDLDCFQFLMLCLYVGHLDVNVKYIEDLTTLAEFFEMKSLVTEIRYVIKSMKKQGRKAKVIHLKPKPLPQQDFMKLFLAALPKDLFRGMGRINEPVYPDLQIKVENFTFSCHKVFICGRSSYLKAVVTDHFSEASIGDGNEVQVITLHDTDPQIFTRVLEYIYTDSCRPSPETILDILALADMYILPGLKKLCVPIIKENLATDNVIPVIKLARLYILPRLEDHCTEFMAEHLEEVIDLPDFKTLVQDDANEIKSRQEVDTISVIDDIRYHILKSERVSKSYDAQKAMNLQIENLLENLNLQA